MKELLIHELQDIYHAEKQLIKALPTMREKAVSSDLKTAFQDHAQETEEHIRRLDECFEKLDTKASGIECQAMQGLIDEAEELLAHDLQGELRDAALISAAQKVEHYEIASYGSVAEWAKAIGQEEVAKLLGQTLREEEATDERLTKLARSGINNAAKAA